MNKEKQTIKQKRERISFINGFSSWVETHHEIVTFISLALRSRRKSYVKELHDMCGTKELYLLAQEWTEIWEYAHVGVDWQESERDYWIEIEEWFNQKNKL
jgi:hypothetical protein